MENGAETHQNLSNQYDATILAGSIFDATGSYTVPFIISGCFIGVAGLICLPVRRIARWESGKSGGNGDPTNARSHYIKVDTFLVEVVS